MKKNYLFLLFIILMNLNASAYDIAVANADGVMIYYNYINDGEELEVVKGDRAYVRTIAIPEEVIYKGKTRKVTRIGEAVFYYFNDYTQLNSVTIPGSVISIGNDAFTGCSGLTSITIPKSVRDIGKNAFRGCHGLKSIVVESNNKVYDSRENCNAIIETSTNTLILGCVNTIIPNNVKNIGYGAFANCMDLASVIIPASVTSIERQAFYECRGLISIFSQIINPCRIEGKATIYSTFPSDVFYNATLYVPVGSKKRYQKTEGWKDFKHIVEFEEGNTAISQPEMTSEANADWYTIDGRKLEGEPTEKGVYIVNGKKVYVK